MNGFEKRRESESVTLCRRSKNPKSHDKEIQGLVFDHPFMPKILTISSGARKVSSSEESTESRRIKTPTGQRLPKTLYTTGHKTHSTTEHEACKQYVSSSGRNPDNRSEREYVTGQRSPRDGERTQEYYTTGHRAQEQYVSLRGNNVRYNGKDYYLSSSENMVHNAREVCPTGSNTLTGRTALQQYLQQKHQSVPSHKERNPRHYIPTGREVQEQHSFQKSPPALINLQQYFGGQNSFRNFHAKLPYDSQIQGNGSEIGFPAQYHAKSAPRTIPTANSTHFRYLQHLGFQKRTQQSALRRNSTGALRHYLRQDGKYSDNIARNSEGDARNLRSSIRYSENVVQHSQNDVHRHLTTQAENSFSTDVQLQAWRESYTQVAKNFGPPIRRHTEPARLSHVSSTESIPRTQSLSKVVRSPPPLIHLKEKSPYHVEPPQSLKSQQSTDDTKRSNEYPEQPLPRVENSGGKNSGLLNSRERAESRIAQSKNPVVSHAENATTLRNNSGSTFEVAQTFEASNAGNIKTQRNSTDENLELVRNSESRDSEVQSAENMERNIEGENSDVDSDSEGSNPADIEMAYWKKTVPQIDEVVQERKCESPKEKRQASNMIVILSDSDDEEQFSTSCYDSDQDVFIVAEKSAKQKQANEDETMVRRDSSSSDLQPDSETDEWLFQNENIHEIENESGCFVTKVEKQSKKSRLLKSRDELKTNGSIQPRVCDVSDNEEAMNMNISGQSGTQSVNTSKQLLFHNEAKGTKRTSVDVLESDYTGNKLNMAARKIRRVSWNKPSSETGGENPSHQSATDESSMRCGETTNIATGRGNIPKLVRSHSENDREDARRQKLEQKAKIKCCSSLNDKSISSTGQMSRNNASFNEADSRKAYYTTEKPKVEESPGVIQLPKLGPKPTGIVVGIKQEPEVKRPLKFETADPEKPAKNYGFKSTNDVKGEKDHLIGEETNPTTKVDDDLEILCFKVVKTDAYFTMTEAKDHVNGKGSSCDQVFSSQQWGSYSAKLEQEDGSKMKQRHSPSLQQSVIKRNSWEELKKKFDAERDKISSFNIPLVKERCEETLKRNHSCECEIDVPWKSPSKRRKLSDSTEAKVLNDSNDTRFREEVPPKKTHSGIKSSEFSVTGCTTSEEHLLQVNSIGDNTLEHSTSDVSHCEISHSEIRTLKGDTTEYNTPEEFTSDIRLSENSLPENSIIDGKPSDVEEPSEVKHSELDSTGKTTPDKELLVETNPVREEELSMTEWIEILEGRIEQVIESIAEETAPWKTKNKKKVLEKLENHLLRMTGHDAEAQAFVTRKLTFLKTMKKQYELMKKVRSQKQTMKTSGTTNSIVTKAKTLKELKLPQEKRIKKTVKLKRKRVKNNGRSLMKKVTKAMLS